MTFLESASLIGSQMLSNWLVNNDIDKNVVSPSIASVLVAIITIIFITREWREYPPASFKEYRIAFTTHIFFGKHISNFLRFNNDWKTRNYKKIAASDLKVYIRCGTVKSYLKSISHWQKFLINVIRLLQIKEHGYCVGHNLAFTFLLLHFGYYGPQP